MLDLVGSACLFVRMWCKYVDGYSWVTVRGKGFLSVLIQLMNHS